MDPGRESDGAAHVDVLVVGAGLSGIAAGHYLQTDVPGRSYAILESREAIGGTWDLFRYPGVRSDSDMFTLGYAFRPWPSAQAVADGPAIREYVRETARLEGIDRHVRFGHRVVAADWSTAAQRWNVLAQRTDTGERVRLTAGFLFSCAGYYRYDRGHTPPLPGIERFAGPVVHPQAWPEGLDHAGRRVVVVGSGATAVTLVPALSRTAAHVTMVQRSPSYVVSIPQRDRLASALLRVVPGHRAHALVRWKNVLLTMASYQASRRAPKLMRRLIRRGTVRALPEGFDVDTHFNPAYDPWDQRMCMVPDGDLFHALSSGRADIATGTIDTFTEAGVRLASGEEIPADIVVTATGIELLALGGMEIAVDGRAVELHETLTYRGMMLAGVPNFALALGYTNASWTLKCDLICQYVTRLLRHMDARGVTQATPSPGPGDVPARPFLGLTSGYVQRSLDRFPRQGARPPWQIHQNYLKDIALIRRGNLEDGMEFRVAGREPRTAGVSVAGA
jgi:cation diffusion facilitator CzcD-associated flavoprotein CzcO